MKTSALAITLSTVMSFICTYFFNLTMTYYEQYLALVAVVSLDGLFGIMAGIKREGFKTFKALSILKTMFAWCLFLTVLLMVEQGFKGTSWLSETILIPFIVFQLISALKNASMAGVIKKENLNRILDKIDKHKGNR